MSKYLLRHLPDDLLSHGLSALVERDRVHTAEMIAHIAEFDERELFAPTCGSMKEYCVRILRLSEDAAYKRIQAARAARDFPVLFEAVADGRLHLTAVGLLAPHLNAENVAELLREAAWKTKAEVRVLVARRFPSSEEIPLVEMLASGAPLAPAQVGSEIAASKGEGDGTPLAPAQVAPDTTAPGSSTKPIAEGRYALHLTMGRGTYDKLEALKALLAPQVPTGDLAEVLDRAMALAIRELQKRKYGVGVRRRARRSDSQNPRNSRRIPPDVREQVWKRDGGRCTYVAKDGRRCDEQRVEFDHIHEFARGGTSTVENLRLLCRPHNRYAARRTYGASFMEGKREQARREAEERKRERQAAAAQQAEQKALERDPDRSVVPWLRGVGFPLERARELAARCEHLECAGIEERVAAALRYSKTPAQSHSFVRERARRYGARIASVLYPAREHERNLDRLPGSTGRVCRPLGGSE